jgi:hypothetical protein
MLFVFALAMPAAYANYDLQSDSGSSGIGATVTFKDVPDNHWAKSSIELLTGKEVISGVGEGIFEPDSKVTRAQFVKMLVAVAGIHHWGYKPTEEVTFQLCKISEAAFTDVFSSDWFYPYIVVATQKGIIPNEEKPFNPDTPIRRDEMAYYAYRMLNIGAGSATPFTDISSSPYSHQIAGAYSWHIINGMTETA